MGKKLSYSFMGDKVAHTDYDNSDINLQMDN